MSTNKQDIDTTKKENIDEDDDFSSDDAHDKAKSEKIEPSAEELAEQKKAQEDADAQAEVESAKRAEGYRPASSATEDEKEEAKNETVPLRKFLDLKSKYKELRDSAQDDLTNEDLEDLAESVGLEADKAKKLVSVISAKTRESVLSEVDERVKPIVSQKVSADNDRLFAEDFDATIAKRYPELADKKDSFKKIAFSKDFLHLKTLEDIRKEFFPAAKKAGATAKSDAPEAGSQGANKNAPQDIDFSNMTDEQHKEVLSNAKLRAKYYDWQDSQGL